MSKHSRFANLIEVFDYHIPQTIDKNFALKVIKFENDFIRRDSDSIDFFGGALLGVYPIRWTNDDKLLWIEDILEIGDYYQLTNDVHDLPDINKQFIVSSDIVNLSFAWVAYKALKSEYLTERERDMLAHSAFNIMQMKFISSLLFRRFKYNADIGVAMALYESLDNKSQLKRLGSWKGLIDNRTDDILGHDSLHTKTIRALQSDLDVVKMINDIWNRLKSIINILTTEFYRIKDTNAKMASTGKFIQVDGEALLKDSFNKYAHIRSRMADIIPDRNTFIRSDLVEIVITTINTVYPSYLKDTLSYISNNYYVHHKGVHLPQLVEDILMYAFKIIIQEKIDLSNLSLIALKLRGVLRSSRIIDPEYLSVKKRLAEVISDANEHITETNMASTRVAVVLYIVLRSLLPN